MNPGLITFHSASLPVIMSLLGLWLVLFLFFGIMYVEVFGLTKWGGVETRTTNYYTLGNALVMLAFQSTGFVTHNSFFPSMPPSLIFILSFVEKVGTSTCMICTFFLIDFLTSLSAHGLLFLVT